MKGHVDAEVRSVAERAVNSDTALIYGDLAGKLEKRVDSHDKRGEDACGKEFVPYFLSFKNRTQNNKIGAQVKHCDKTLHPFIVAPKRFGRIYSENVGKPYCAKKNQNRTQKPRKFWPKRRVSYGKDEIGAKSDFNKYPKNKGLSGNKRKEKRGCNDKRNKRREKQRSHNQIFKLVV